MRAVLFDCDGVLVDSEKIAVRVDVRVLGELGWVVTEAEVVERFVGRSDAYMRAEVERAIGRPLGDDWDATFNDAYREALAAELEAVDGIVEAIDGVEALGLMTCVASSGTHDKMRFTLGKVGLWDRFEGRISSATEVERGKPAPDLFLLAASRLGVPPAECVVVEDSRPGVEAAVAAGMRAFGYVGGGLVDPSVLEAAGAVVFDDMRDLPTLLEPLVSRK